LAYDTITYTEKNHVAFLAFNRPQALNALTHQLRKELLVALTATSENDDIRVIILAGAGKAFSVGQDLKEMDHDYRTSEASLGQLVATEYVPLVRVLMDLPKPSIALVRGPAVGGGMSLALAADFRVLSKEATLVAGFVQVGLAPDTGTSYLLPQMIGQAHALRILLTGATIKADEALTLGLADSVEASPEDAESAAWQLAERLAAGPTQAYKEIRRLVRASASLPWELALEKEVEAQERLSHTQDHRHAVSSFLEKKIPEFQGQ
jgi:2-(1,2-epoxy-1,2-dihydrophenyl)acetyl-CoA isomerase